MNEMECTMLNMVQELTRAQVSRKQPPKAENRKEEGFEQVMDRQYRDKPQTRTEQEQKPAAQTDRQPMEQQPQMEDAQTLEQRMSLAAMAMMAAPVIQPEQIAQPVEVPGAEQSAAPVGTEPVAQLQQTLQPAAVEEQPAAQQTTQTGRPAAELTPEEPAKPTTEAAQSKPVEIRPAEQEVSTKTERTVDSFKPMVREKQDQEPELQVVDLKERKLFDTVKTVPVKVGETAQTPDAKETLPVNKQMEKPLMEALKQGESRVEIQLTPASLGSVRVELTRHADGTIQVLMTAENSKTQSLLDRHAASLQTALSGQNQEPVRVTVQQPDSQQHNSDYPGQDNGQNGQNPRQQHREPRHSSQDFMQQLRLGLAPMDPEAVS